MKKRKFLVILICLMFFVLAGCTVVDPNNQQPSNPNDSDINEPSNPGNEDKDDKLIKNRNVENFVSEQGEVPKIIIYTRDNVFPYDKENYVKGTLQIVEQPNEENVIFEEAPMGIRLRGNSTYDCPKKPFRIKFDQKQSLFGLPKAKSWVLLANYYDKSHMRNYLAYLTANKLNNLDFQPASIFVEVEINGEYQGLYLLCEQMQTGTGRVDIEQDEYDPANPTAFFELDFLDRILADGLVENQSYFETHGYYFGLKYPDSDDITVAQCANIKRYVDRAFNKIFTAHNYDLVIDVDSFIDYYLINELFKNVDVVQTSVYFYLKDGMVFAGPVWDFDIALGVVGKNEHSSIYEVYQRSTLWVKEYSRYYKALFSDIDFLNQVKARYQEVRSLLAEVYTELEIALDLLEEELQRDVAKWGIPGELYMWLSGEYCTEYRELKTYDEHIAYLKKQLNMQFIYMDNEFLDK